MVVMSITDNTRLRTVLKFSRRRVTTLIYETYNKKATVFYTNGEEATFDNVEAVAYESSRRSEGRYQEGRLKVVFAFPGAFDVEIYQRGEWKHV